MSKPFNVRRANKFLNQIERHDVVRYMRYWAKITPQTPNEYALRWVFAFMSIHTGWKKNVEGYQAVARLDDPFGYNDLRRAIKDSRVGLDKIRLKGIWQFHNNFKRKPDDWKQLPGETLTQCRDRLAKDAFGIGMAKTSFAFEMALPFQQEILCLDTHILRLYDYSQAPNTPSVAVYHKIEQHWSEKCKKLHVPNAIARHIYWDKLQGYQDTTYWSFVFHEQQRDRSFIRV